MQQAVTENEWGVDMKFSDFKEVTLIQKGWSEDKKYCVVAKDGQKYLLRISPMEQYDRKKSEYECTGMSNMPPMLVAPQRKPTTTKLKARNRVIYSPADIPPFSMRTS